MKDTVERSKVPEVALVFWIIKVLATIRQPRRVVGPGVDDGMTIDVVDTSHDALLEFVF